MATFPLSLVAPLLLLFTLSPLSSHCANIESLAVPSSVTPKAAAIQYWYAKVHSNKPPPHALLSKLSSRPPLELLITDSDNMKSFKDAKKLENLFEELRQKVAPPLFWNWNSSDPSKESESLYEELRQKDHNGPSKESEDRYTGLREKRPPLVWNWNSSEESENHEGLQKESEKNDKNGHIHTDTVIDPLGVYFRVSDLRRGNIMRFVDFRDYYPQQYFLPRTLASKMPFSSAAAIKKMFHIMPADAAGKNVDFTVKHCNMPPNFPGEIRQCVTSAEDLIDFVIKGLGTDDVEARSTESTSGCGRDVLIGGVKLANEGNALSCHQVGFPYLVHHCHVVPKTRIYEVEILDVESKEKINHAAATCHMDTSMWTPTHEVFRVLRSEPGKTEVCHFISKWDILWTSAADVAAAEA